jgi:hypothetical protein
MHELDTEFTFLLTRDDMKALGSALAALLLSTLVAETLQASVPTSGVDSTGLGWRVRREVESHDHGEEGEEDAHGHAADEAATCAVRKSQLVGAFNEVAEELNLTGADGQVCYLPVPECHHHDDDEEDHHDDKDEGDHHEEEDGHHDDEEEGDHHDDDKHHDESGKFKTSLTHYRQLPPPHTGSGGSSYNGSSVDRGCLSVYEVCQELIVHSGLAPPTCLSGECPENTTAAGPSPSDRPTAAEAYGLGFLMVVLVSLGSLLGVAVVPLITTKDRSNTRALVYKYLYFFMIALGASALLSDAILHLFPHVSIHSHHMRVM